MSKNHDIDSTRQIVVLARNAGIGVKPGLVLAILQELEETRAKHRKEWGRAEKAEAERDYRRDENKELHGALQAAEAKLERVREVCESSAFDCNTREWGDLEAVATDDVLTALDGGEQE